jgi:ABC-type sugar transport system permease subunit
MERRRIVGDIPAPAAVALVPSRRRSHTPWTTLVPYLAPLLVGVFLINLIPFAYTVFVSLTNRNGAARFAEGRYQVTGIQNYLRLLGEPDFYLVLARTAAYVAVCVTLFCIVGLLFAVILNNPAIKGKAAWRTLLILPWAVPSWISVLIWRFLFHSQFGPINQLLRLVGVGQPDWLINGPTAFVAVVIVNVWLSFPFYMLVLLAGLQAIPDELYEAAATDGARPFRRFIHVTIPMIRPTIIFTVIVSTIGGLQLFTEPYLFQPIKGGAHGGSARQYQTVSMYLYEKAFGSAEFKFGYAAAIAWCLFLLIAVISLVNFLVVRRIRSAEA